MGLQVSHTDKNGTTHANSYWVVSDVKLEKKLNETPDPAIALVPGSDPAPAWNTTPGYYGRIVAFGWRTKADRDAGKDPEFVGSVYKTDHASIFSYHEYVDSKDGDFRMEFDPDSTDSLIAQAYTRLLELDMFADATVV